MITLIRGEQRISNRESIELEVFSSGKLRVSLASYSDRLEKDMKKATKQKECL